MISSMSVPICNDFHARQANEGKKCLLWGGALFLPFIHGDASHSRHEILSQNNRDSTLSHSDNQKFLSQLGLNPYQIMTDGWTELLYLKRAIQYRDLQIIHLNT